MNAIKLVGGLRNGGRRGRAEERRMVKMKEERRKEGGQMAEVMPG